VLPEETENRVGFIFKDAIDGAFFIDPAFLVSFSTTRI
jgi:hypothetical protein